MIDRTLFDRVKARRGAYASWAVWANPSDKPKSNVGDLDVLDPDRNSSLLRTIRADVVMVGLNISRPFHQPFRNFHDPSSKAQDFKIRHAFTATSLYGAYMTDFIKNLPMVDSTSLLTYIRNHPSRLKKNVATFLAELEELEVHRPTILAFGGAAYGLLADNLPAGVYSRLVKITHYSHRIGMEAYRRTVLREVELG